MAASKRAFRALSFSALSCSPLARAAARACASAVAGPTVGAGVDGAAGSIGAGFEGSTRAASADGEPIGVVGVDSGAPAESGTRRRRTMTVGCRWRTSARGVRALRAGWMGAGARFALAREGVGERDSGVDERDPGVIVWATSFRCARGSAAIGARRVRCVRAAAMARIRTGTSSERRPAQHSRSRGEPPASRRDAPPHLLRCASPSARAVIRRSTRASALGHTASATLRSAAPGHHPGERRRGRDNVSTREAVR
jgi:hypothetical protein